MLPSSKVALLALGVLAPLTAALAQQAGPLVQKSVGETLVVLGQIDWLEKSDVSALREGVIKQIEFHVGDRVKAGDPIGYLHDESVKLAAAKAEVAANSVGAVKKAEASKQLAIVQLAMCERLQRINPANVSMEELKKAQAEVLASSAAVEEANDNQKIAKAEWAIAKQAVSEYVITAPFTGYVTDRLKGPGESVKQSEPVLRLVRTDLLRFFGYLPLESAGRVTIGDTVEVRPVIEDADLPIEKQKFRGKIKALTREISTIGRTEIQVLAEITNVSDAQQSIGSELLKGMKAEMTIYLGTSEPPTAAARTAVRAQ